MTFEKMETDLLVKDSFISDNKRKKEKEKR